MRPKPTDEGMVERISEGLIAGLSIRKVCAPDDMPSVTDVYVEMARNEDFRKDIARARELQQEAMVDETVDMAEDATVEDWQLVKMRIWARQWRAAKLAPNRYGDRQILAGDKDAPLEVRESISLEGLDSKARAALRVVLESVAAKDGGEPDKA